MIVRYKLSAENPPRYSEEELARLRALTDEEITAAALSDPDNPPLTDAELRRMAVAARLQDLRRAHNLTQEAFAKRFHIPLGTLRDLEQARRNVDAVTRAYLKVIEADPAFVARALEGDEAA
jgi:putative transcriptional regulator